MPEPIWVREDVVRAVHRRQLAEHGGGDGVRDENLLLSALDRPKNLMAYGEPAPDVAALGASYASGLARNHAFVDGNKRTPLVVCRLFMRLNGFDVQASQEEKYLIFLHLTEGALSETELAQWLRERLVPTS